MASISTIFLKNKIQDLYNFIVIVLILVIFDTVYSSLLCYMLYISDSRYTLKLNKHSCNKHAFIALFPSSNYVLTDEQSLWIEDTTKSVYQLLSENPPDGERFSKMVEVCVLYLHSLFGTQ